mgnify:CR=1 FL=1
MSEISDLVGIESRGQVLKYSNQFYDLQTSDFGVNDWRILFAILYYSQSGIDYDEAKITIPTDELKNALNWKKSHKLFIDTFYKSFQKIVGLQTTRRDENDEKYLILNLFSRADITDQKTIIKLNKDLAEEFFKDLAENFTMISLQAVLKIGDSKATINLFFRLQRFIDTGKWIVSFADFKKIFGLEKIKDSDIVKKYIEPSVESLKYKLPYIYSNLRYEFESNNSHLKGKKNKKSLLVFYYQNPAVFANNIKKKEKEVIDDLSDVDLEQG